MENNFLNAIKDVQDAQNASQVKNAVDGYLASQHVVYTDRIDKAIRLSYGVIKSHTQTPVDFTVDDIFIVWFSKTLKNWKAILSASFPGAPLVEATYNGDKRETYIDIYKKIENIAIPDVEYSTKSHPSKVISDMYVACTIEECTLDH